jgi:Double zinc ribbon
MLCTFCGTENRLDNKFCGMCGVRLERRKVERRAYKSSSTLKCQACGHANEPGHRFCGMCGAIVDRRSRERRTEELDQPRAAAIANAQLPSPEIPAEAEPEQQPLPSTPVAVAEDLAPRGAGPVFRSAPARSPGIGGPSFLGLNDDPERSAEYLLDDEGQSGGVIRKVLLVAVLLAIAGYIFMQWRYSQRINPKSHEAVKTQPAPASAQSSSQDAGATETGAAAANAGPDSTASPAATNDANKLAAPPQPDATKSPAPSTETAVAGDSTKNKTASLRPKQKAVEDAQARPSAELLKAQQYLQGRGGVAANCEQGLVYLRAAAQKNEPAAAVQMSSLYATGRCVQQDRVMAYRWLNSAHELAPANASIQTSMDVLWGQMTSQERRQAGR